MCEYVNSGCLRPYYRVNVDAKGKGGSDIFTLDDTITKFDHKIRGGDSLILGESIYGLSSK